MTSFTLYRAEGLMDLASAKRKTIIVLGLGSLGSLTVSMLAYEWGKLILVDPDVLKQENIERHLLGKSHVGSNKAEAMRDWLVKEKGVPEESVVAYPNSDEEVLSKYPNADLVICCIDDQASCRRINDWCLEHDVPAVYGGVYPKGMGGEVISLPAPGEVCYLCADHSRGIQSLVPLGFGNYGIDPSKINVVDDHPTAVPALKKNIDAIAADTAIAAWKVLFPEADDLPSLLLYHAFDGWTKVAQVFAKSNELKILASFIGARTGFLLAEDNLRFGASKDGWYSVEIRNAYWPKAISQWNRCPKHGQGFDLNQL